MDMLSNYSFVNWKVVRDLRLKNIGAKFIISEIAIPSSSNKFTLKPFETIHYY